MESTLEPILRELQLWDDISCHYVAGTIPVPGLANLQRYFGLAPHLRFLENDWPGAPDDDYELVAAQAPPGLRPEDLFRYIERRLPPRKSLGLEAALDRLYAVVEEHGPFDCILGHSEGATVAASFVVDFLNKQKKDSTGGPLIGSAVFVSGSVPFDAASERVCLADRDGTTISIPTCHIFGYNDPALLTSLALFNLCNYDTATIVDHGRGHTIPHDPQVTPLMAKGIRDVMRQGMSVDALDSNGRS